MKQMKWPFLFAFILLIGCNVSKQSSKVTPEDPGKKELFSIGDDITYTDEFIYVYNKNNINNDSAFTKGDIKEYLDLYINFKLKIKEAKSRGMDTTAAFIREYNTYKDQLKKPYLTENKVTEQLLKEAYNRYKQEVNASHILVTVASDASPEDTLKAFNKIMGIRERALKGEDFAELAKEYSDDPSAASNGGNLGYFTSFQMVYPFETAAYITPVDSISQPVRTKFGYHIIKVLDKRSSQGSVEVSHIMIRMQPNKTDSTEARNKIFEIYDQAVGGVSWDDLAKQFSEDINTKNNGGRLKPFTTGQMPYPFQEAAFALEEPGDISDPVMTAYGWHIIRLEKKLPLDDYNEMEPSIKAKISRDSRAQLSKHVFISKLKKENHFIENPVSKDIMAFADSSLTAGRWKFDPDNSILEKSLFSVASKDYHVNDFFLYLQKNQRPNSYSGEGYMNQMYNNYVDEQLISYEEDHLEDKYEDYRMLSREYKEGILLFQLMEEEVWNKAVKDSVGLRKYYEDHLDKYTYGRRVEAKIYNANEEKIITDIQKLLNENDSVNVTDDGLKKKFNEKGALSLQIEDGVYQKGDKDIVDMVDWKEGTYSRSMNGRFNLVVIDKVLEPGPKPLNEVKGLVISDYQNLLEKKWVEKLKEKYPVDLNEENLSYMYEELVEK